MKMSVFFDKKLSKLGFNIIMYGNVLNSFPFFNH